MTGEREHPILFSGPMVLAILDGRKTQTRRVVKPQPDFQSARDNLGGDTSQAVVDVDVIITGRSAIGLRRGPGFGYVTPNILCPYGQPGDTLWVRETWGIGTRPHPFEGWCDGVEYRADDTPDDDTLPLYRVDFPEGYEPDEHSGAGWKPSIHMPRWASRLTLEVTAIRVERVQEISHDDAKAEGIERHDDDGATYYGPLNAGHADPVFEFQRLWDSLNAKRGYGWDANPFVWVVEFRKVEP